MANDHIPVLPTLDELRPRLESMLAQHSRLTMACLDLDNFMEINQRYGRAVGDQVLATVTRLLAANLSDIAALARHGDEFYAILTSPREVSFIELEELRRYIHENQHPIGSEHVSFTVSTGLAGYPEDARNAQELWRAAESALFIAKRQGRNQIRLAANESMTLKSNYYTGTQLERLSDLARRLGRTEASLLREALDDLLRKYSE
ncbi:MAG: diguanylate cyclase [Bacillota bacterium]